MSVNAISRRGVLGGLIGAVLSCSWPARGATRSVHATGDPLDLAAAAQLDGDGREVAERIRDYGREHPRIGERLGAAIARIEGSRAWRAWRTRATADRDPRRALEALAAGSQPGERAAWRCLDGLVFLFHYSRDEAWGRMG